MRLLYTNSHPSDLLADERAGHLVRARCLIAGLEQLGHTVFVHEAASGKASQAAAIAYHEKLAWLPRRLRIVLRDVARIVQSAGHGWRLGTAAKRFDVDAIVETHNTGSIAGWIAAQRSRRPLVLDDVTPSNEDNEFYEIGLPLISRHIRRRVLRRADRVVTVSRSIEATLRAEGVDPSRIGIVTNGTLRPADSAERGEWRARLGVTELDRVLVYVGSFQPFHDVPLLISAVALLNTSSFLTVLVGDGDTRVECEGLARDLGVGDRLRFIGRVPHGEIPGVLAAADAAVLAATAEYMNPMKLYEYAAAGLPIAAPDQPAVIETLPDLTGVHLFVPGDSSSCAAAIAAAVNPDAARPISGDYGSWAERSAELADLIASTIERDRR